MPEHLNNLINYVSLFGSLVGFITLVWSKLQNDLHLNRIGLLICILVGATTISLALSPRPVQDSFDQYSNQTVLASLYDLESTRLLQNRENRQGVQMIIVCIMTASATLSLLLGSFNPTILRVTSAVTAIMVIAVMGGQYWAFDLGKRLAHIQIRQEVSLSRT